MPELHRPATGSEIKVWDPLVRVFHWSLVLSFATAYVTGELEALDPHELAGYTIGGLILFRLLWGFTGPQHARFADFVFPPATVLGYARDVLRGKARRYLGHNPLGGAMVVALLGMLTAAVLTGLAADGAAESPSGPLAGLLRGVSRDTGEALAEIHEFCANLTLILVALHLGGVVMTSLQHRENLVRAMFTGRKRPGE